MPLIGTDSVDGTVAVEEIHSVRSKWKEVMALRYKMAKVMKGVITRKDDQVVTAGDVTVTVDHASTRKMERDSHKKVRTKVKGKVLKDHVVVVAHTDAVTAIADPVKEMKTRKTRKGNSRMGRVGKITDQDTVVADLVVTRMGRIKRVVTKAMPKMERCEKSGPPRRTQLQPARSL